jgi:hypothetical protein
MPENYFKLKDHIGSSLLASYINDPDAARKHVQTSNAMSNGKLWEDFLEEWISGKTILEGKYYMSKFKSLPSCKMRPPIPEIMDTIKKAKKAVPGSYVLTKSGSRNDQSKTWNNLLDEIQENGYKMPITTEIWSNIQKAWENFKKVDFEGINLTQLLSHSAWQVEHTWKDELCGADCRAKYDTIAAYSDGSKGAEAITLDIKFTGNMTAFIKNWKTKYIWQNVHYSAGAPGLIKGLWDIDFNDSMNFVVTENTEPFLTHIFYLKDRAFNYLKDPYNRHLNECWQWIKAGRPFRGYAGRQALDQYGRNVTI